MVNLRNVASPHDVVAELCASGGWIPKADRGDCTCSQPNLETVMVHRRLYHLIPLTFSSTATLIALPPPSVVPQREGDDPHMTVLSLCTLGNLGTARDYSPEIFQVLPVCRREADVQCTVPATILSQDGKALKRVKVQATVERPWPTLCASVWQPQRSSPKRLGRVRPLPYQQPLVEQPRRLRCPPRVSTSLSMCLSLTVGHGSTLSSSTSRIPPTPNPHESLAMRNG